MQVTVQIKSIYGVRQAYPVNEAAKIFAAIAGTKTLTAQDLRRIQSLGFEIVQRTEPAITF